MTDLLDTGPARLTIPVLTLRGLTVFPQLLLHFDVGRDASIRALEEAMEENQEIFLVTQRDLTVENPGKRDLYAIGTVAEVKQILRLPENGHEYLFCCGNPDQYPAEHCGFGYRTTPPWRIPSSHPPDYR